METKKCHLCQDDLQSDSSRRLNEYFSINSYNQIFFRGKMIGLLFRLQGHELDVLTTSDRIINIDLSSDIEFQ